MAERETGRERKGEGGRGTETGGEWGGGGGERERDLTIQWIQSTDKHLLSTYWGYK